ncbi:MAG: low molecular weight phosphatase family protein [Flavobacteriaceae bacterium]
MLYQPIQDQIERLDETDISESRKLVLHPLADYIQAKINSNAVVRLNFICTHNSRRSHLSQIWAQTMAHFYKIKNVYCYSGGTESTALFSAVAETLSNTGFEIQVLEQSHNPIYALKFDPNSHPVIGFSKSFDSSFNPSSGFAAIMTCSSADEGCPIVSGAEARFSMTYEDPKAFDNTPQQNEKYLERSLQIATELKYIFSKIKKIDCD